VSIFTAVRHCGKPDLFVTVTCNPRWPEILQALAPNQSAYERPDIVARVFRLKLNAILDDITKHGVLGRAVSWTWVIEFQKRGLPHAHILIILADEDKLRTPEDYDSVISAEIPDPRADPELYETVSTCMMHGPCGAHNPHVGATMLLMLMATAMVVLARVVIHRYFCAYHALQAPCMKDGRCSKNFPKEFCEHTEDPGDRYPVYRRRDHGRTVDVSIGQMGRVPLDNRWVVPYNPALSKKYNCHINVEICSSISAVKYLHKYVYKGHDRAYIEVRGLWWY
jgi:hypothetical protein